MVKLLILDRVKFRKKGVQAEFIFRSKEILNLTWTMFAKRLEINSRTLRDWSREKFSMSLKTAEKISKLTKLSIPEKYSILNWNDHLKNISKQGGKAVIAKYGQVSLNEEYRKEKWREWWKNIGQYKEKAQGFQSLIELKTPAKSRLLAEFIGIMLGDGGVNQYHTSVTLSSEEKYYILYVRNLINKLFGVMPEIYKHKHAKAVRIVVNRKQLVDFCQSIGLVMGNKVRQQAAVPEWIKGNELFTRECVRGLIDTDGCFYNNSYKVNGKEYSYQKIAFTNSSLPLILFVYESLKKMGIRSSVQRNRNEVRIVDQDSVLKYIKEIGTHNPKHLEKIK